MTTIPEEDLDWSKAEAVRKKSVLATKDVRVSEGGEHIVTLNDDGVIEREGTTAKGDRVVTDTRGQPYIVKQEKFPTLYELDPANPEQYRSKNHGLAMKFDGAVTIQRKDGTEINTDELGVLFRSAVTGTVNHITRTEYEKTYAIEAKGPQ